ncbi:hypothetical protein CFBP498_06980 [Xanthomonas hortorum pv. vitians]|uniref:Uncharacterized protein n=3 Tax=Xanthomonas hortorum TaxID=56454 RepID=A0A6V7BGA0_9XANT|nr:hypothetical protein CFBP2533_00380 [Xanthomonas hortorum pv. pelargonii]CAD0298198.1 hypothetical protein NCPPB940_00410 [Xanthomonas hortorum pv. taraxaci]CAD0301191.1 hypothetical protein CFBP7900_00880 [Xanthomonas hortorum pv. carotae]CAD0306206.1 hypothetical protein CFBP498_06980 [Xanthomonas hortorum pv. vitians]CAD0298192.1 hypothetical protein CFBP2533_00380 [Xanthomonas hortorum pv. pelargonii]
MIIRVHMQLRDGLVPLSSIAVWALESGPSEISRHHRQRCHGERRSWRDGLSKTLALTKSG